MYIEYKKPTLRDLCKYVIPKYAHEWQHFGVLLHFEQAELDIMQDNCHHNSKKCCRSLLSTWLEKYPDALWDQLFSAIGDLGMKL